MASSLLVRLLEIVVDDDVVEERVVLDLGSRVREASLHRLLVVAGARAQAPLELGHRRRQNEDRDRVGHLGLDLPRALVVDVEDHAAVRGLARCSISRRLVP